MQKTFTWHSATIAYRVEGKGKPVVLLHGFGEDSTIWNQQVAYLKEYCLLITPDLPGSGKSALLSLEFKVRDLELKEKGTATVNTKSQTPNILVDDYADCIYALLQEEKISTCTMLGHSMGGYITLAFAENYPSVLNGFGLIHATAFADSEEKKKIRERGIEMIEQYGAHSFLKTTIPNLFGKRYKEAHPEKIIELISAAESFTKEALQQYYRAMISRPNRAPVLESNPLPVLFVMGTEDVAAPIKEVLRQTYLPNNSYIHVLQETGHMGMWEAPDQLNAYMLAFINR